MTALQTSYPDVHQMFMNGDFVVQRQERYRFYQVSCDRTIEQTCNRDTNTKGGMVGFTLKKNASQEWILSHTERAAIISCFEYAERDVQGPTRKVIEVPHSKREKATKCQIIECMEGSINPFTYI